MKTFKDFYQKELNESPNNELADELRDCLTTIYQVAKNARDEGIEFKGSVLKEINNNINVLISNIENSKKKKITETNKSNKLRLGEGKSNFYDEPVPNSLFLKYIEAISKELNKIDDTESAFLFGADIQSSNVMYFTITSSDENLKKAMFKLADKFNEILIDYGYFYDFCDRQDFGKKSIDFSIKLEDKISSAYVNKVINIFKKYN